ncbi:hypothetical protein [Bradyrhizobium sp. USDA 4353]
MNQVASRVPGPFWLTPLQSEGWFAEKTCSMIRRTLKGAKKLSAAHSAGKREFSPDVDAILALAPCETALQQRDVGMAAGMLGRRRQTSAGLKAGAAAVALRADLRQRWVARIIDDQADRGACADSGAGRARQMAECAMRADALKTFGRLHEPGCDHLIQKIHAATPWSN